MAHVGDDRRRLDRGLDSLAEIGRIHRRGNGERTEVTRDVLAIHHGIQWLARFRAGNPVAACRCQRDRPPRRTGYRRRLPTLFPGPPHRGQEALLNERTKHEGRDRDAVLFHEITDDTESERHADRRERIVDGKRTGHAEHPDDRHQDGGFHLHDPAAATDRRPAEQIISQGLYACTPNTIADPGRLRDELRRIYGCGFAIHGGEMELLERCIGAPVRNAAGRVIVVLSLTDKTHKMSHHPQDAAASSLPCGTFAQRAHLHLCGSPPMALAIERRNWLPLGVNARCRLPPAPMRKTAQHLFELLDLG